MSVPPGSAAAERWARTQELFHAALEQPPTTRTEFLATAAGADEALRAEVESLLASDQAAPRFLDARLVALPGELLSLADAAESAPLPPFLNVGERVGAYRVARELGRGGMGVVYLAERDADDAPLALKVLVRRLATRSVIERFRREVRVAARLRHRNVLPVLDSGGDEDLLWFTMPFVAGGSLRERLTREGPLPVADAVRVTCDVARALHHAHERGIVHRDVKPENVLLAPDGTAFLVDFGISRRFHASAVDFEADEEPLTHAGMRLGTPAYMSPEQACGDRVDQRSDLYSLACMLHELLTGQVPFQGRSPRELFARRLETAPPSVRAARPDVPQGVDDALRTALHRDPLARYWSAARFASALDGAA